MKMDAGMNICKKKILICGLGIGKLYYSLLKKDYNIITIDSDKNKNADFLNIEDFLKENYKIDLSIISLPNFLHEEYIYKLSKISNVILVEKPGLKNIEDWNEASKKCKKLIMVKNNLYRDQLQYIYKIIFEKIDSIKYIHLYWLNKNRIPYPGSWFTNKELAFGGVSYDLMPHLLHFLFGIIGINNINKLKIIKNHKCHNFSLEEIIHTDYGNINKDGVYDVDDYNIILMKYLNINISLISCWQNNIEDKREIDIGFTDNSKFKYIFDLCPDYVYKIMIDDIIYPSKLKYIDHQKIDKKILEIIGG